MREPTVESLMTRDVVTTGPATPFTEIVGLLAEHRFSAVPVVDGNGRPVGVVSEADLLVKEEHHDEQPAILTGPATRRRLRKAEGTTARDVMTAPVTSIGRDVPASAAARRLADSGVRRLFVVDEQQRLVGVLSRRDLLRVFLRDDASLRQDVVVTVFQRVLSLEPAAVEVTVEHGIVTLKGELERRSEVDIAVRLTHQVPGVVGVVDHLTYRWDDTAARRHTGITG